MKHGDGKMEENRKLYVWAHKYVYNIILLYIYNTFTKYFCLEYCSFPFSTQDRNRQTGKEA